MYKSKFVAIYKYDIDEYKMRLYDICDDDNDDVDVAIMSVV